MNVKISIILAILLVVGSSVWGYTFFQNQQAVHALEQGDVEQLEKTLSRPFVTVHAEWMNVAIDQFDVQSSLLLYEHGAALSDEQWVYLADLMTFTEFKQIIEAGAKLEVASPSQTLIEGLYSLNDEPEKWRFAHERIDTSFLNDHPQILMRTVYDGNTEAFIDLLGRMEASVIPFEALKPIVSEMDQQLMLEALLNKQNELN
ncbi:hypothetical protein EVJ33_00525 [Exiguobacterium sp. SL-10]|uniref:hypothetical protein n=1 Tax=Exiguobacterium sp. SL-10 TaxID=2510962 RepID=UPI00103DD8C6|nr:hypothetical protein [Exiguobacterium sp. SL-10]TCI31599.1 hypothetical protein EVJ33_00525 [Exiguobacterium sp. SL-10]